MKATEPEDDITEWPYGAPATATSPPAFVNKPYHFPNSYLTLPFAELDAHNCGSPCLPVSLLRGANIAGP
jgi:hypothetical protein